MGSGKRKTVLINIILKESKSIGSTLQDCCGIEVNQREGQNPNMVQEACAEQLRFASSKMKWQSSFLHWKKYNALMKQLMLIWNFPSIASKARRRFCT